MHKYLLSIYYAPDTVFPGGGLRVGLGLIGLWIIETHHKPVEIGLEMHWLMKQDPLGGSRPQACLGPGVEAVVPRLHRKHVCSVRMYSRGQTGEGIYLLGAHILSAPTIPLFLFQRWVYLSWLHF